jgi:hypothetical protein
MSEQRESFTISPDVIYQQMGDEVVLLHIGNSHYYGLDEVGARFWQLLAERGSVEATIPTLLAEFEVEEPLLRADLQRLLEELTVQRLLEELTAATILVPTP